MDISVTLLDLITLSWQLESINKKNERFILQTICI